MNPETEATVDVVIIGAGIAGIGAAHHLIEQCPGKRFLILENKESFGGTWLTHTYPGARSDSDLYTYGYRFKPWTGAPIASAGEIRNYLEECITDDRLERFIRYRHEVSSASWDSKKQAWHLSVERHDTKETIVISCGFLMMCGGYYRHDSGYTPEWDNMSAYRGQIVHPQSWPKDLDYKDKRVIVIGSGATAATVIPSIAEDCSHLIMLQRSPTYFTSAENRNELADTLRELEVPDEWTHEILRRNMLKMAKRFQEMSAADPELVKKELIKGVQAQVGEDFDMSHFTPSYRPWQQRIAHVPDGDLFAAIKAGKVSMVTDHIDHFTPEGIKTQSGKVLEADIIVTATGFNPSLMGDIPYLVDGAPVDFSKTFTYRGLMNSGVPNMSFIFGYLRTTYTMRVDIVCDFICRLINTMDDKGAAVCMPTLARSDQTMSARPWIDPEEFNPSYMRRILDRMPRRGDNEPWFFNTNYYVEKDQLPVVDLDEEALVYTTKRGP
jgi:cation diffusion facilitator CzcD-associated flavoprotein CzcO